MDDATNETAKLQLAEYLDALRKVEVFRYGEFSSKLVLANGYTIHVNIKEGKKRR